MGRNRRKSSCASMLFNLFNLIIIINRTHFVFTYFVSQDFFFLFQQNFSAEFKFNFAILFAIKCADGATPNVADGAMPNVTDGKTPSNISSTVNHSKLSSPRYHLTTNSSASSVTTKKPSSEQKGQDARGKPSKAQLSNMQVQLIAVESAMAMKHNERYDCSRKILNLKRSLANEVQKCKALDQEREKMAKEAIDLKISIQNGILALGQK